MSRIDLPGAVDGNYIATRVTDLEHEVHRLRKTVRDLEIRGTMNKTFASGYYLIPAGPTRGTSVASSASADTYGSYVELRAASGSVALYIVGFTFNAQANGLDYGQISIATGGAGSESVVSESRIAVTRQDDGTASSAGTHTFVFPIPIPANTRIAVKTADDVASAVTWYITLHVIDETDILEL